MALGKSFVVLLSSTSSVAAVNPKTHAAPSKNVDSNGNGPIDTYVILGPEMSLSDIQNSVRPVCQELAHLSWHTSKVSAPLIIPQKGCCMPVISAPSPHGCRIPATRGQGRIAHRAPHSDK